MMSRDAANPPETRSLATWRADVARLFASLLAGILLLALLHRAIDRGPRFVLAPDAVVLLELPPSVDDPARLRGPEPWLPHPVSLMDPVLPSYLRSRLEESPWIASVERLERRFDGRVEVRAKYRVPVGVLRYAGERIAVDEEGYAIESRTRLGPPDIPEIRLNGPQISELPLDGGRFWQAPILEAASLLGELRRHRDHGAFESLGIRSVVVGGGEAERVPGSADLVLRLERHDCLIRWGRAPVSPYASIEVPTKDKLDGLLDVLRTRAGLLGLESVDLFSRDPIIRPKS